MKQKQRELEAKELVPFSDPNMRQWAHLDKHALLRTILRIHREGEQARSNKLKLDTLMTRFAMQAQTLEEIVQVAHREVLAATAET